MRNIQSDCPNPNFLHLLGTDFETGLLTDDFTEVTDFADSTDFAEVFEATDFTVSKATDVATDIAEAFDEAAFEGFDVLETDDFDFESETADFNEVED